MKFWKFEYEGAAGVERCRDARCLPPATASKPGLKNTFEHPAKSMKIGDGVVLATLDGEEGKIFAIGRVRAIGVNGEPPVVDWAKMTTTVLPDARGGLINWQTKTAFEISPEPAKKYGLKKLVDHYV